MICSDALARKIVGLIKGIGDVTVVNDVQTDDSIVEHNIDLDIVVEGSTHNVTVYVTAIDLNK
jgi:hypothetical protein